jgi:hypothetical protein
MIQTEEPIVKQRARSIRKLLKDISGLPEDIQRGRILHARMLFHQHPQRLSELLREEEYLSELKKPPKGPTPMVVQFSL